MIIQITLSGKSCVSAGSSGVFSVTHIFDPSLAAAAGASGGAAFEAIYDSIKMKKSSFYFNQFKDMQARKLKSENLRLERELGGLTLVLPRSIC